MAFPMGQVLSAGSSRAVKLLLFPRNPSRRCSSGRERCRGERLTAWGQTQQRLAQAPQLLGQ